MALCKNCKKVKAYDKFCSSYCYDEYRKRPEVIIARFWKHVTRGEDNECWIYGAQAKAGIYKQFTYQRGSRRVKKMAHVFSYMLANGKIPKGKLVCHTCDVPRCVNPNHLFLGTPADNIHDCWAKGRHPHAKGEGSTHHKFTNDVVLLCRQLHSEGYYQREIAEMCGMSQTNVSEIVNRKTWAHI